MENKSGNQLEKFLEDLFKKLPPLPANVVDTIFKITPILALVFGILGVLLSIAGLGVLSALAPFAMMGGVSPYGLGIVATVGWLISSVMMLVAFLGLKAGKKSGWDLLFWSEVVNAATAVIGISIGSVLGAAIAFYILFQIKPKYK